MVVGICRITLVLATLRSLKEKRAVTRRLTAHARRDFNVAIAEVGSLDAPGRLTLGLSVVSNDRRHAQSMLDAITHMLEQQSQARFVDRQIELCSMGDFVPVPVHDHALSAPDVASSAPPQCMGDWTRLPAHAVGPCLQPRHRSSRPASEGEGR
ncbi:MAG: DUF503 domain-containing protein [Polyangiales bacterium]